jgi:hypothetical protein
MGWDAGTKELCIDDSMVKDLGRAITFVGTVHVRKANQTSIGRS